MFSLKSVKTLLFVLGFSAISTATVFSDELSDAQQIFKKKCSLCHAIDKKKLGPSVKTMSNDKATLLQVITEGKKAMPGFEGKLSGEEITALVDYLLSQQ